MRIFEKMEKVVSLMAEKSELVIALCALLISFVSILLSYISFKQQRLHNRLTLRPIGKVYGYDFPEKVGVEIVNEGNGPLFCSNLIIRDTEGNVWDNLYDYVPKPPTGLKYSDYGVAKNFVIQPDKKIVLIMLDKDSEHPDYHRFKEALRKQLGKLTIEIKYRDIYNEEMPKETTALDWFLKEQEVFNSKS